MRQCSTPSLQRDHSKPNMVAAPKSVGWRHLLRCLLLALCFGVFMPSLPGGRGRGVGTRTAFVLSLTGLCEHRSEDWDSKRLEIATKSEFRDRFSSSHYEQSRPVQNATAEVPHHPHLPTNKMNNSNYNYTTNENNSDTMNNNDHSTAMGATKRAPARKPQHGTPSALYKLAARNLREYHGVPSLTALKLQKTVALLGLAPRRLVVQGLVPRRLLMKAGESSGKGEENLAESETGELMDASDENNFSSSSEKRASDDPDNWLDIINRNNINGNKNYDYVGVALDDVMLLEADGIGKARRPIHDALVAGGINLRPDETRPLLRALGVKPHRLVRLGLVKREALRAIPPGRGGGPGQRQLLGAGGPRKGGMGRPHGPPQGPPSGLGGRPVRVPPCSFHRVDHHTRHLAGKSKEEGVSALLGPLVGPENRRPRQHGGRHHDRGPTGGGKHGHGHRHPPDGHGCGQGHGRGNRDSEREEGKRPHGAAARPGRQGGRRGRSHGPPHGPPRGSFHEGVASGAPHGKLAHARRGSPSQGCGGM